MDKNTEKEMNSLKQMVINWKNSYIRLAEDNGESNLYLLEDFEEDIRTHFPQYMKRLLDCGFLDINEYSEFIKFVDEQTEDLKKALGI